MLANFTPTEFSRTGKIRASHMLSGLRHGYKRSRYCSNFLGTRSQELDRNNVFGEKSDGTMVFFRVLNGRHPDSDIHQRGMGCPSLSAARVTVPLYHNSFRADKTLKTSASKHFKSLLARF